MFTPRLDDGLCFEFTEAASQTTYCDRQFVVAFSVRSIRVNRWRLLHPKRRERAVVSFRAVPEPPQLLGMEAVAPFCSVSVVLAATSDEQLVRIEQFGVGSVVSGENAIPKFTGRSR